MTRSSRLQCDSSNMTIDTHRNLMNQCVRKAIHVSVDIAWFQCGFVNPRSLAMHQCKCRANMFVVVVVVVIW